MKLYRTWLRDAVLLSLGLAALSGMAADSYVEQLRSYLKRAETLNRSAKSLQEWQDSGYTPRDIFQSVRDLGRNDSWAMLCQALGELSPEELALFDTEISIPQNASVLPCSATLLGKLETYWSQQQKLLAEHHSQSPTRFCESNTGLKLGQRAPSAAFTAQTVDPTSGIKLPIGVVALTFDGGPHPGRSLRIAETLKKAGVRAMFFPTGEKAYLYHDVLQKMAETGQGIGAQTKKPIRSKVIALNDADREIEAGKSSVETATAHSVHVFRFPDGDGQGTPQLAELAKKRGMSVVGWTVDSKDWQIRNPEQLMKATIEALTKSHGGILLLHDTEEQTAIMLPHLLEELKGRNLSTVIFAPR